MSLSFKELEFVDPVYIEMEGMKGKKIVSSSEIMNGLLVLDLDQNGDLIGIEIPLSNITVKGWAQNHDF